MLTIDDVAAGYAVGVDILDGLSLRVEPQSVTGVIGANGAGKSTLLKTIFGLLVPSRGEMTFQGQRINGWAPAALKRAGISYFPQGSNIFPHMTVEENLRLSCWVFRSDRQRVRTNLAWARELFPVLSRKWQDRASLLSGGEAKMLSLAKEIVSQPVLMLVDEPSAGLAPKITEQVYEFLAERRREGATILLVDQNVSAAVRASDYVYMLDMGRVAIEGPQERFSTNLHQIIRESLFGA